MRLVGNAVAPGILGLISGVLKKPRKNIIFIPDRMQIMKKLFLYFGVVFALILMSCGEGTYTIRFVNPKLNSVLYVTAPSSRPVQLLSSTAFGEDSSGTRLMMWSTRKESMMRDGITPRSDSEISNPESDDDLNFKPSSLYNGRRNLTLYAIWTSSRVEVKFDANGGSFPDGSDQVSMEKQYGAVFRIPSEAENSDSAIAGMKGDGGGTFLGWSKRKVNPDEMSSFNVDDLMIEGDVYSGNGAITLYAVWGTEHFNIKYVLNEDSVARRVAARNDGGVMNETASFASGDKKIDYIMATQTESGILLNSEPSMAGCRFVCWSTDPNRDPDDLDSDGFYLANSKYFEAKDMTLYAIWKENEYTVQYYPDPYKSPYDGNVVQDIWIYGYNDFSNYDGIHQTKYYFSPLSISDPSEESGNAPVPVPNSEGYKFLGWRRGDSQLYSGNGIITENRAVKLYGQWEEKKVAYTLRFVDGLKPTTYIPLNGTEAVTTDLSVFYEDHVASSADRVRGLTANNPDPIVRTYDYWSIKGHEGEISTSVSNIGTYQPSTEGFKFEYWTASYNGTTEKISAATKMYLNTFAAAEERNSNREILAYEKIIYSKWTENTVKYVVNFANGERNQYVADNPTKSVISGVPSIGVSATFHYWEHALFDRSQVSISLSGLSSYVPKCEGFDFRCWSLDESGATIPQNRIVAENTGLKLNMFTEVTANAEYRTTLYSRWDEKIVKYYVRFLAGSTETQNAYMKADGRVTNNFPEDKEYEVKYWDHRQARNDEKTVTLPLTGLDSMPIPKFDAFESYWSTSSTAGTANKVTQTSGLNLKAFDEDFADSEYSMNLYSHWGDPIVGKVMKLGTYNWIIIGVDKTNKKMKLFLNQCSNSRIWSNNGGCSTNCSNHLQYQRWNDSDIRYYLNSSNGYSNSGFRNTLPQAVRNLNVATNITTGGRYPCNTTDYIWLPSSAEMSELNTLFGSNATFKANVFKASWQWQRDNNATSTSQGRYYYTGCAVRQNDVVWNMTNRYNYSNTFSPMGYFTY